MQREQGISSTNTSLVDELYYDTNSLEVAKEKTIYKKVINIEEKRRKSRRYYFMRNRVTNRHILTDSKLSKRTFVAMFIILLAIPFTIYWAVFHGNQRENYYMTSLIIVIETMIPFFMVFEDRDPQARELVIIAVLAAIAVAGRGAFFMLPQFKPVAAIVIITGVCFGGEAGFLVGAVSGLVSNFFFGQGPWTPWQMFAFGIIGFIAGVLFKKGMLKKKKISLCIYGGISTFLIYGFLLDTASILMFSEKNITKAGVISVYISGVPFNIVHAISTIFFLFVLSKPMIEKLDRIKIKYGLIEP
ncbi:MAG: ECF transporter S component [Terrisporobacter othiniensis]|uniref:ECF transporter S component n=1 Tax=Terrisporobacter othiniensis TaxID=1577792 RepID=UPI0009A92C6E|nr:ECF transporter S component [Terrisporobacter othiniensis]MDY3371843.1 ECF transporter S component [Terrisporobacter othiniensis]